MLLKPKIHRTESQPETSGYQTVTQISASPFNRAAMNLKGIFVHGNINGLVHKKVELFYFAFWLG